MSARESTRGRIFKARRKARLLTQAAVAATIGCSQSQISDFEHDVPGSLSGDRVAALASALGLDAQEVGLDDSSHGSTLGCCTNPECPAVLPRRGSGEAIRFEPWFHALPERYCRFCGEPVVRSCPNEKCRAPLRLGLHCGDCGMAYIEERHAVAPGGSMAEWYAQRIEEHDGVRVMLGLRPPGGAAPRPASIDSGSVNARPRRRDAR